MEPSCGRRLPDLYSGFQLLSLSWTVVIFSTVVAWSAPPNSCRDKFVGKWVYFGGYTDVHPDGTATPSRGVPYQKWTCNGDQYHFSNPDGQSWTATLSPDGNKLLGAGTATRAVPRQGGTPAATAQGSPRTATKPTFTQDPFVRITPLDLAHALRLANQYIVAARASEQTCAYADQTKAAENYQTAARFFEQARDSENHARMLRAAQKASLRADECEKKKPTRPASIPGRVAKSDTLGPQALRAEARKFCKEANSYLRKLSSYDKSFDSFRIDMARECGTADLTKADRLALLKANLRKKLEASFKDSPQKLTNKEAPCPPEGFWGSLGYERGFKCMPYGKGPPPAKAPRQSGISK